MAPRRKFDKKAATTFSVVHRAHDDALYFDNDASRHVLVPVDQKPGRTARDGSKAARDESSKEPVRENAGLAAQYGVYYDDSKYDYMQHLKPIGQEKDAVFIAKKDKPEKTARPDLFEALKGEMASTTTTAVTQDDLENIPSALQGFNPNMDPRLREALEALEDEAYIASDDEDVFGDLLQSGQADDYDDEEDDDEWDLDNYEDEYDQKYDSDTYQEQEVPYNEGEAPEEMHAAPVATGWGDVNKFLSTAPANEFDSDDDFESEQDEVPELPTVKKKSNTKARKKKGAMTDTSSFSMSSSAVYRTEGLTLLDDKFEVLAEKFDEQDEEAYEEFDFGAERDDLEGLIDDFLDNYELERGGRKLTRKNDELKRLQESADSVSKGKAAARRQKSALDGLADLKI